MKDKNTHELEIIEDLKQRFGAEEEEFEPSEDELQFIQERDELEEQVLWSFEKYVQSYELLKAYGLEEKLINELEWFIVLHLEINKEEFLGTPFYQQFKDHEVVKRAFLEYERKMELNK